LDAIAELTGWKPSKIAEELGMSESWVWKYISQKYKNPVKVEAGFISASRREADIEQQAFEQSVIPESTITEDEKPSLEMVKILISVPGNIYKVIFLTSLISRLAAFVLHRIPIPPCQTLRVKFLVCFAHA